MGKQLSRCGIALVMVASLLFFAASPAAAHDPSCGDHPNQNRGFAVNRRQSLTGEQVGNARLIMGIAQERRLPRRAAEIAITAALQASSLKNSPGNDRGLFQQTPRYYPGVAVSSPRGATNAFYDRLVTLPRWQSKPIATTARTVQGARATRAFTNNAPIATAITDRWWGNKDNPTRCPSGSGSTGTQSSNNGANGSNASADSSASSSRSSNNGANGSNASADSSSSTSSQSARNQSSNSRARTTTTQRQATTRRPAARTATPPKIFTVTGTNRVRVGGIVVNRTIGTNLQGLLAAASADGLNLRGSGWRDPARQIALRKQNCGLSNYSVYRKSPSLCKPPTARPGTSNHEKGLAVDFRNCSTRRTTCYKWLNANASKYGLRNLPSEPWHWSVNGR